MMHPTCGALIVINSLHLSRNPCVPSGLVRHCIRSWIAPLRGQGRTPEHSGPEPRQAQRSWQSTKCECQEKQPIGRPRPKLTSGTTCCGCFLAAGLLPLWFYSDSCAARSCCSHPCMPLWSAGRRALLDYSISRRNLQTCHGSSLSSAAS